MYAQHTKLNLLVHAKKRCDNDQQFSLMRVKSVKVAYLSAIYCYHFIPYLKLILKVFIIILDRLTMNCFLSTLMFYRALSLYWPVLVPSFETENETSNNMIIIKNIKHEEQRG